MDFNLKKVKGYTIIDMPEIVNYEANLTLKGKIEELCAKGGHNIGIDLGNVSFMGSLGIGLLSFSKKLVESSGGLFCLISPNSDIVNVMKKMNLNEFFTVYNDVKDIEA